jgi:hypothetical protein
MRYEEVQGSFASFKREKEKKLISRYETKAHGSSWERIESAGHSCERPLSEVCSN